MKYAIAILFSFIAFYPAAQTIVVSGKITDAETGNGIAKARVSCQKESFSLYTKNDGSFSAEWPVYRCYELLVFAQGYEKKEILISLNSDTVINVQLKPLEKELTELVVKAKDENEFSVTRLNHVEGTSIYAGKKTEVILLEKTDANLATNNGRQVYAKIAGLNIWESDGAGLQLGIGGRGLSPNRTSNFNSRQNGYDISADALGYPESYYTPSTEALERIEVIRGASSLQYGTQFGGVVNFVMKKGSTEKPVEVLSRNTVGSFNFFNSYNSVGGTYKKWNYITSFQYKKGGGWRENSGFEQYNYYANVQFDASENLQLSADFTKMNYLAQQPGGLTDVMFAQNPRQSIRNRNWFSVDWNLFSFSVNYLLNEKTTINSRTFGLFASRKSVGYLGNISRTDPMTARDLITGNFNNFGNETRFLTRYSVKEKPAVLLVGVRLYKGRTVNRQGITNADSTAYFQFTNPSDLEGSDYLFPSKNAALFAENIFYLSKKVSVTPGIRMEYINTSSAGYYKQIATDFAGNVIFEQNVSTTNSRTRWVPLAGIGISYKPSAKMESYANISQNYRAINFSDLQVINPNYKVDSLISDEYGYTADAGVRGNIKKWLTYDVSVFYINYKNRIGEILQTDVSNLSVYRYRTNIADSYNAGTEFFSEINFFKLVNDSSACDLSLFTNVAWVNAFYINSEESAINNKRVELVPQLTMRSGISFRTKRFSCAYQFSYVSDQFTDATNATYTPNAVSGLVPAYYVMDLSASYTFKKLKIETGINNLTNNSYFTRRASAYPGPGIIPADGRSFYLALQVKI